VSTKPKGKPRNRPANSSTITCREFCRRAGVAPETYRRKSRAGLMPRALPGGIPRDQAVAWLQAQADAAAAAVAAVAHPSTPDESSAEGGGA
jgi:hypothetical protein